MLDLLKFIVLLFYFSLKQAQAGRNSSVASILTFYQSISAQASLLGSLRPFFKLTRVTPALTW